MAGYKIVIACCICLGFFTLNPWAKGQADDGNGAPAAGENGDGENSIDAEALVRGADLSRSSEAGLQVEVRIVNHDGEKRDALVYRVRTKSGMALIQGLAPSTHRGEVILLRGGRMFYAKPGLSRPISISSRQRLMGRAVNGDIALTRFADDYQASLEGEESLDGIPAYRLLLQAKTPSATYERVRYWIAKDSGLGIRADFLNARGVTLKTATYEYDNRLGHGSSAHPFLSRMIIRDPRNPSAYTVLTYGSPKAVPLDPSLFSLEGLLDHTAVREP